jgi:hypothetical protein
MHVAELLARTAPLELRRARVGPRAGCGCHSARAASMRRCDSGLGWRRGRNHCSPPTTCLMAPRAHGHIRIDTYCVTGARSQRNNSASQASRVVSSTAERERGSNEKVQTTVRLGLRHHPNGHSARMCRIQRIQKVRIPRMPRRREDHGRGTGTVESTSGIGAAKSGLCTDSRSCRVSDWPGGHGLAARHRRIGRPRSDQRESGRQHNRLNLHR